MTEKEIKDMGQYYNALVKINNVKEKEELIKLINEL